MLTLGEDVYLNELKAEPKKRSLIWFVSSLKG